MRQICGELGLEGQIFAFGVRKFDTYGILAIKLVLTLLIFGLNKRWHFSLGKANLTKVFSMVAKVSMVQIIERKE